MSKSKVAPAGPKTQNAFAGHSSIPSEKELSAVLGKSYALWKDLVADLKRDLSLDMEEWKTYSIKVGWSLRLLRKKRNIIYLGPRADHFLASFILGDRAITATAKLDLPGNVRDLIATAKRYPEGTAVRIEVHTPKDVDAVKALAKVKVEN